MAKLDAFRPQSSVSGPEDEAPDHWWHFAIALCGIPIEYNDTPLENRPIVTWLLAAMIAAVSLIAFRDLETAVREWGMIPAELTRRFGLTSATSTS